MSGPQAQAQDGAEALAHLTFINNLLIGAGVNEQPACDLEELAQLIAGCVTRMLVDRGASELVRQQLQLELAEKDRQLHACQNKWRIDVDDLVRANDVAMKEIDDLKRQSARDESRQNEAIGLLARDHAVNVGRLRDELLEALQALQLAEPTEQRGRRIADLLAWAAAAGARR